MCLSIFFSTLVVTFVTSRFAMSSLPAEASVDAPTSLLVPNSFLIFRLVFIGEYQLPLRGQKKFFFSPTEDFIALLSNLSLLQLIFASWNITSSLSLTRSGMFIVNVLYGQEQRVMELYNSTFSGYHHYFGELYAPLFSRIVGSSSFLPC